ncbi:SpvB/TcaC N-terminal domain-containing protein [Halomonas korlensis]|nr:SpvB/TcaC N-terminal domain-containing protein [Halomonas korlensis]
MGEKFAANPITGTGSMSVPIATSPGRSGFGPELSLSYDSGAGNGPFGFGWNISLPTITRKTDKGLPQYRDTMESDVFILSGAEDLVPEFEKDANGNWVLHDGTPVIHDKSRTVDNVAYRVRRYRPRIEGLFARIERWTNTATGEIHWRSISKDNITTLYGKDNDSRIFDPADPNPAHPTRIFSWLICQSYDDKGNVIVYGYQGEDSAQIFEDVAGNRPSKSYERNRTDKSRSAQRYLKRIRYGNRVPYFPVLEEDTPWPEPREARAPNGSDSWLFEVVFDYGEHDANAPKPSETRPWPARSDPFSSYRAGFEVRTYRLCRRVLMFHHFPGTEPDGVGADCLVRSTDFTYSDEVNPTDVRNPVYAFLRKVTQTGYRRNNGDYDKRNLPPVEFEYTEPIVQDAVEEVDPKSLENLPVGLDGTAYRWTDLHGEGIPGVFTEQAGGWFYKRNLSPINERVENGTPHVEARFAPDELVATKPNLALGSGAQFMDLAGDGQPDLVVLEGPTPGLYEHDSEEGWQPFRPFTSRLNRDFRDPNLKFVDLDGDGHADVLITEDDALVWHHSLEEAGFGPARRVAQALDEEKGPRIVFADGTQSIYLADLSGDGLTDLVRIRNGEACYWPNLGYGRFGAKVTMDNAPWFDHPDQFHHKRIRLADIDGSGTTDIIYLHRDGVRLYFNQSGNGWSQPHLLKVFPRVDDLVAITPTDLLGNGTACLVWSSPLPGDGRRQMRYVNLMGRRKPHLLIKTINNLGAETRVDYAPSTRFYLQDKRDGKPWVTRLSFPVHVVERVVTYDHISRNRFVTRYAYHHGYFDGEEREFRGFGMVEQWDTGEIGSLAPGGEESRGEGAINLDAASNVPPVHTKSWFHTGVYVDRTHISLQFEDEYYREPGLSDEAFRNLLLPDTHLSDGLTLEEEREACRALKGQMLRQELYADDAGPDASEEAKQRACIPYTVIEQDFTIRPLQPRADNRHAVYFTHPLEVITYHYERNPADPRIQHALTLEVDDFDNVLKEVAVGYGRRQPDPSLPTVDDRNKQTLALLTYTEKSVTNAIDEADGYRTPLPCEAQTFELTGYSPTGPVGRYQASDFVEPDPAAPARLRHTPTDQVAYEAAVTANPCRRPIEWLRTLYRRDDLSGLLPLGEVQPLALPGESYKLAFTPGLLAQVFQRPRAGQPAEPLLPDPAAVLGGQAGNQGGYLRSQTLKADGRFPATDADDHWWIPSERSFYSTNPTDDAATELAQAQQHFFLPRRYRDPFGQDAFVDFDGSDLLMIETRDALDNRVTVNVNDYRVLHPRLASDPNRNQTEVAFDTLGMVVGTTVMGEPLPAPVEGDSLSGFVTDLTQAQLDAFFNAPDPHASAAALLQGATTRIVYDLDRFRRTQQANPNDPSQWQPPCAATLARETHLSAPLPPQGLKVQLSFSYSDGFGREIQQKIQAEPKKVHGVAGPPRWVGSGWTIFNNKGKPVRQYEPFFSATHGYEFNAIHGVSPVLFYDPAERVIATLHPNHTYEKVVFDPWQQTTYDFNDTCAARNDQTGDPRTDPDISGYVEKYFKALPVDLTKPWLTWHAQRGGGALGPHEQAAATLAAAHADTPTTAHFDALGRPFLTVARNRVVCAGHDLDGTEESFATRVELDIEGNQRAVLDERKLLVKHLPTGALEQRVVMRYAYDMLGNRIHQLSMEAGARWMLSDVTGNPIRAWDSRGHNFTTTYDALRRPVEQTVRGTTTDSDPRTLNGALLVDRIEYGESLANAEALNLRTRIHRHFGSAGVATNARLDANGNPIEAYDFKGNLLRSTRHLISGYKTVPDWSQPSEPQLESEFFEGSTRYDALNRPIQSVAPHSSLTRPGHPNKINVTQPVFNEANLLERVDVWLERAAEPAALLDPAAEAASPVGVANIDYDAKGQRQRIDYKNGASTLYSYDPQTFRLTQLLTRRDAAAFPADDPQPPVAGWPGSHLQNLHYTYDPAGNVTHIRDDAQQTVYFKNRRVESSNDYTYDALYRLIQASGREHLGQGGAPIAHSHNDAGRVGLLSADAAGRFSPNDGNAMGSYIERYVYDAVGNFLQMQHRGSDPAHLGWTRRYAYGEASLIEGGKQSNRLGSTQVGNGVASAPEPYQHDAHGNIVCMPHLGGSLAGPNMHWDYKDQLRQTDLGGSGAAYYVYDASGQRVRKIWEKSPGRIEERIYLGGFEIFRRYGGPIGANTATLERETLHVMDNKQRIALVETRTLDTAGNDQAPRQLIRYQFGNHLGSASLELDGKSQIISYEEYSPYGSSTYQAVRSQTETAKRYRYTGKEQDEESGFCYHGARYYSPWLGRWTSADPEGLVDGANLFPYGRNNPLTFNDPTGTQCDPAMQSCIDPTESTAREEALQQSLSEEERYLPPASFPEPEHSTSSITTDTSTEGDVSNRIPLGGNITEDEKATLAAAGIFWMPDNSADIGTPVHLVVLPILAARLAGHGIPSMVEAPTLYGGSKSGQSAGFIDLTVLVPPVTSPASSALEAHVYDLKPGGSSSGLQHAQQVQRYVDYFDNGLIPGVGLVTPQVGTVLYDVAAQHPDILSPIDVPGTMGTAYIGLQLTSPGIIEYHLGARPVPVRVPVREPVVERVRARDTEQPRIRVSEPDPVPWYIPVGTAVGAAALFVAWKAKGCIFGPVGCAVGAAL